MEIGVIVPQGWTGEYDGWSADAAWQRTRDVARQAEALGYESIWLYDHLHTTPDPTDEITFESLTTLSALAALTERVRLGHVVVCTGFRNPALLAKMVSTMDIISGGRMELGIGAGWKREEWLAYGYDFPPTPERLAALADALEIARRMFGPGRATFEGKHARVDGAINVPKPLQERVPIMVGGNGQNVTWRLAARYADELNLDGMPVEDFEKAMPIIASRCEEIGRDPATLRVSIHVWWEHLPEPGAQRAELIARFRELGAARLITLVRRCTESDEALASFADDCRQSGATLEASTALGA